jgi:hypothetical protein
MAQKRQMIALLASAVSVSISSMANYDADAIDYARAVNDIYLKWLAGSDEVVPAPEALAQRFMNRRAAPVLPPQRPQKKDGSWLV